MKRDESLQDRFVDALLKEEAKGKADDALLAEIESAIENENEGARTETAAPRRSYAPLAWAAVLGLSAAGVWWMTRPDDDATLAAHTTTPPPPAEKSLMAELRAQEDLVAEKRKTLPALASNEPREMPGQASADPLATPRPEAPKDALSQLILGGSKREGEVLPKGVSRPMAKQEVLPEGVSRPSNHQPGPRIAPAARGTVPLSLQTELTSALPTSRGKARGSVTGRAPARRPRFGDGEHAEDFEARPVDRERYGQLVDQPWNTPWDAPLSTFSVDVDTASYTNIRRMLRAGQAVPKDSVRIEECINYFDYRYAPPANGGPFAVHVDSANCPWQPKHHLVKIGLKGKEVNTNTRPASNLVFLIDVSGSMRHANKLPLLIESMKILVEELDERDSVGIVVYAGSAGTILNPTKVVGDGRTEIMSALDNLSAGGSTAGAAGITGAYDLAAKCQVKGGVNRVILATDGDFNVGVSNDGALVDLVKEKAKSGIYLSVLGFGTGNLNDTMMEAITNDGNGNYFYIDSEREGRKVFLQNLSGTLVTIAKDVKIQVEFNPGKVAAYRLIGYANRILPPQAFNDDKVDAGDIGAGHTVTALYEVVPVGVEMPAIGGVDGLKYQKPANRRASDSPEWMTVKLRYKAPDGDKSTLLELPVKGDPVPWKTASPDFQFAAGVALFGEKLRQSDKIDDAAWEMVTELTLEGAKHDPHGHRAEFRELVKLAGGIPVAGDPAPGPAPVEAPPAK